MRSRCARGKQARTGHRDHSVGISRHASSDQPSLERSAGVDAVVTGLCLWLGGGAVVAPIHDRTDLSAVRGVCACGQEHETRQGSVETRLGTPAVSEAYPPG